MHQNSSGEFVQRKIANVNQEREEDWRLNVARGKRKIRDPLEVAVMAAAESEVVSHAEVAGMGAAEARGCNPVEKSYQKEEVQAQVRTVVVHEQDIQTVEKVHTEPTCT